ncbi:MAG: transposase [Bacillota bacterium]|nr:transposase [Bacillota bacterium]
MPRIARQKQEGAIYHVMARSISEVLLFKNNEDKRQYLLLLKEYQKVFGFIIYAYCIMDNHLHLIIFCNGADISKIMHCINFKYARYYNLTYKRHGHLFQDRFKSKIVTDDRYLIALSAYIHNNPSDIHGYENNPQNYYFSSFGIYLNLRTDDLNLVDIKFILKMFGENINESTKRYFKLVVKSQNSLLSELPNISQQEIEFCNEKCDYISGKKILVRNFNIDDVIQYVADKFNISKELIHLKFKKGLVSARGILVLLLRNLCNIGCSKICSILGNITISRVSKLSSIGVDLISNDTIYRGIIKDFISSYS